MTNNLIDPARSADLTSVGLASYIAAVVVADDGSEHVILAERASIGDVNVRYDPTCEAATHEQLGTLPIETVERITVTRRNNQPPKETR